MTFADLVRGASFFVDANISVFCQDGKSTPPPSAWHGWPVEILRPVASRETRSLAPGASVLRGSAKGE